MYSKNDDKPVLFSTILYVHDANDLITCMLIFFASLCLIVA